MFLYMNVFISLLWKICATQINVNSIIVMTILCFTHFAVSKWGDQSFALNCKGGKWLLGRPEIPDIKLLWDEPLA